MLRRTLFAIAWLAVPAVSAWGQAPAASGTAGNGTNGPGNGAAGAYEQRDQGGSSGSGAAAASRMIDLPNNAGQVWKEYDLAPYTSQVTGVDRPEQAVIDWILRETGTEIWFSEPLGILSASPTTLSVYHTPEIHEIVRDVYYRFVNSQAESYVLSLRLVTLQSPNWRSVAYSLMKPVTVQSPGVEAWLLSKENAALMASQLSKRVDFRELKAPNLLIHNGQSHTLSRRRPKNYVRTVSGQGGVMLSQQLEMGQIQEGYALHITPLMSLDGKMIDAVLKCEIDQVEKLVPITVDIPTPLGQLQRVQIQIPQIVSWRLHERFRWPVDEVMLLSCGVVATPAADRNPLGIPNLIQSNPLTNTTSGRADALLFIESKGKSNQALLDAQRMPVDSSPNVRGRY